MTVSEVIDSYRDQRDYWYDRCMAAEKIIEQNHGHGEWQIIKASKPYNSMS